MDVNEYMQNSWNDTKNDTPWLINSAIETGNDVLERYEKIFGKKESLEIIIKGYPYSPIPAKNKEDFRQNYAQIILDSLDDLNALLGTQYSISKKELCKFIKVGFFERLVGEYPDLSWYDLLLGDPASTCAYHNPRTGNLCFRDKNNMLSHPKKERKDTGPHEMCHKILTEIFSSVVSVSTAHEGICTYAKNVITEKYGAKADLDIAITGFNTLDYGFSLADEKRRTDTVKQNFGYFEPYPNLKRSERARRNIYGIGYAAILHSVENHGESIIRELVDNIDMQLMRESVDAR